MALEARKAKRGSFTKHRDRKSYQEAIKECTYGQDHRWYCSIVELTPSNSHYCNWQKKTRFGVATGGGAVKANMFLMWIPFHTGFSWWILWWTEKIQLSNTLVKTISISTNICIIQWKEINLVSVWCVSSFFQITSV